MSDYSKFEGKKVKLVRNEEGVTNAVEIEGTVQSGNALGILIKPKGKTNFELIPAAEIESVEFIMETAKNLDCKTLKVVEFGQARAHVLERHGWTLKQVNTISELDAYEKHAKLDHVASDLGHVHGEKDKTDRAEAVAAATVEAV